MVPNAPSESHEGIMPVVDIATASQETVMRVQGLLLSHGFGPEGLVGEDGHPDGIPGQKTTAALSAFNSIIGAQESTLVSPQTWYCLLS